MMPLRSLKMFWSHSQCKIWQGSNGFIINWLPRARQVVENTFGSMANRFRLFLTTINLALYKVNNLVLCCCIYHSFLRKHIDKSISVNQFDHNLTKAESACAQDQETFDVMTSIGVGHYPLPTQSARQNSLKYMYYFNVVGTVEWHNDV